MLRLLLTCLALLTLGAAPAGAVTHDADGTRLVVTGTDGDDTIAVAPVPGGWSLTATTPFAPTPDAAAACTVTAATALCRQEGRTTVQADGRGGDDRLTLAPASPGEPAATLSASGGPGADVLTGAGASDWLDARDGDPGDRVDCAGGESDFAGIDPGDVVVGCERLLGAQTLSTTSTAEWDLANRAKEETNPERPAGEPAGRGDVARGRGWAGYRLVGRGTRVRRLVATGLAPGATVVLRCRAPGRTPCPVRATEPVGATSGTVDLAPALRRRVLQAGTVLTLVVSEHGRTPRALRWTTRAGRAPRYVSLAL